MKKLNLLFVLLCFSVLSFAQEDKGDFDPHGSFFGKVFFNYHYDLTKDVNQASAFEIKRSYFGAKYALSEKLSTKITFDVGSNSVGSSYTAYLKVAQLDWKVASRLKLTFGLMGLKQFKDQEKFWGYRYIYKSFQDQHKFGSSADLGLNAEIKLHKKIKANLFVINGEGYKSVQDDFGMHKFGGNIVAKLVDGLTAKVYYDMNSFKYDKYGNDSIIADTSTISTLAIFVGYEVKDKFRFGAEYNILQNGKKYSSVAEDYELSGISVYATYIINKKFEVFGRFDQLSSNKLTGATDSWNNSKDGNAIIIGGQYAPIKGVKMALNYQGWTYAESTIDSKPLVYINFEYKF
ncbi:MAG: hypothetical protein HN704_04860 [Bacteroidetes bacterium]|jgi:hypothetical protein|nr:hypothetical protein [Bacteroidota bacterium]MBT6685595.1 hypothetical protein [Bacteroidota bacterium]MBT7142684.1 hypothetical protein [Bacteroidota bacterium]MBT7490922.1 hypothetical protein [Bacteroidota bacterium]